ncbi:Carboxyl/Cholinesterase 21 [Frankliniella occidentalis]|nr:Carboxyl/Cholinesterase 21 [Frankliniella occidentalis]
MSLSGLAVNVSYSFVFKVSLTVSGDFVLRAKDNKTPTSVPPEVTVGEGTLRGEWVNIPKYNKSFAAFRGIPYAQPPVGQLRFKAPLPPASWFEVRDATKEGSACLQQELLSKKIIGSEDCLYLNVYHPQNSSSTWLPVYFFIHGGSFLYGSGSHTVYGPDFFMLKDVVVVTINYRLNAFGFLNLDNDAVPGNAGIKDQVAALQWVSRNIHKFGGDPHSITVGGQSAGAASAHWLSLFTVLTNGVILESGSALHSWAYNEDNFDVALDLGSRLTNGSTVSLQDVAHLVMELPAMDILAAAMSLANERMYANATQIPFATSPERRNPLASRQEPLIRGDPESYILTDSMGTNPIRMLMGMNSREWLASIYLHGWAAHPDYMRKRIKNLVTAFPKSVVAGHDTARYLNLNNAFTLEQAVDAVYQQFFKDNATDCDDICVFKEYLDHVTIGIDTNRLAELRVRTDRLSAPTFVYRFAVRANYSTSPLLDPAQAAGGAVHSDELGYLWKMNRLQQDIEGDDLSSLTLRRMVDIWTTFIKHGHPEDWENRGSWIPNEFRRKPGDTIFLNIAENLTVREEPIVGKSSPFWLDLFQKYRDYKST